jgi:Universal stress protein UspA and related nucleotide-binding proteins
MYNEILFPTDGSDGAEAAFDHVLDIADAHGSRVRVLNVADTNQPSVLRKGGDVLDVLKKEGKRIVGGAADRARERGVSVITEVIQGEPYRTVVGYADSHDVDLIVMPTHGRQGLERFLLGSTTERVVRRAEVPVLTVKPDGDSSVGYPYGNVLVPTDGSDCARAALATGVGVVKAERASIHLVSVIDTTSLGVDNLEAQVVALEESANEILEDAFDFAEDAGIEPVSETVRYGASVHGSILSYIEDNDVDLVVVGTHGRTGFDRYMLGSFTEYLIRTSPIPVLTVRETV